MPDLLWEDVRVFFDPELMGALPDAFVADTSVADWQSLFNLLLSNGWRWEYRAGDRAGPLPSAAEVLSRPADADLDELHVWPAPGILVIFRPMAAERIDFDVDLRELQGQGGVDVLCGFLRTIGRALGKPVVMTPEGGGDVPILGFEPAADRVVLLAEPWSD